MDRVYRRQRHIYDLTRKYYLFGRDRVIRNLDLRDGDALVEVGCGTARNLIAVGRRYPEARLFGLDASSEMLKTAQESIRGARLKQPVGLVQVFAEELGPYTFNPLGMTFDRALFSYSLSMIPDWRAALAAAASVLKPQGRIEIVDFGDLTGLGTIGEGLLRWWLGLFHVRPRAEILQVLEPKARDIGSNLWISPGRYAFSWSGTANDLAELGFSNVAAESQSFTKPRQPADVTPSSMDNPASHRPE